MRRTMTIKSRSRDMTKSIWRRRYAARMAWSDSTPSQRRTAHRGCKATTTLCRRCSVILAAFLASAAAYWLNPWAHATFAFSNAIARSLLWCEMQNKNETKSVQRERETYFLRSSLVAALCGGEDSGVTGSRKTVGSSLWDRSCRINDTNASITELSSSDERYLSATPFPKDI